MTPTSVAVPAPSATVPAPQIKVLLTAVFLAYLAQMTLNPIIAPLSREVGLAEWQVGVTISSAAIMMVLVSGAWGRRSQSRGRKPVLVLALALGVVTTSVFAVIAQLGMAGLITGTTLFVLFVVFRGIGFGLSISAIPPTAQAYIADITPDEETRVAGMARVGAVQGVAQIAGAVIGGLLAWFGLLTPLIAVPLLFTFGLLLVLGRLRREPRTTLIEKPTRVRPTDPRIWPFLLAGFGLFTALGFVQIVTGFIVQDRLHLDANTAGVLTGAALLAAGLGMVLAQGLIVPRTRWTPATLLRVGGAVVLAGFLLLVPDAGPILLFGSIAVVGIGFGIAMPGFTAGPTLLVTREEQGGLAGLVAATMGLTFVVAPTAGTALYSAWPPLPIIVGAAIMAILTTFVLTYPRFRQLPHTTPADSRTGHASRDDH
ncbi:MFS transporter [Solwaraspora sp. WMMD406]|uniref:MFS transporter n=1 Tax=Solwaraspora sp. WMMD406 TaxID=3016095 RepID=UPI002415D062|nr:MFS transporter [Solwaraspora sp. WMMD406]MDG4765273.1 MFS transporter [Solwaraspora sp. WMMD406]